MSHCQIANALDCHFQCPFTPTLPPDQDCALPIARRQEYALRYTILGFHSFLQCGESVNLTRDDIMLAADLFVFSIQQSKIDRKDSHSSAGQAQTKSHAQFEPFNNICSLTPVLTSPTVHLPLRCSTTEAGHQQRNPQPTVAPWSHKPHGVCHPFSTAAITGVPEH